MNDMRISQEHPARPEREARTPREGVESQEQAAERLGRETLRAILERDDLDPATALEVVATYDGASPTDERLEDVRLMVADFGLDLGALDPVARNELITLYVATDKVLSEGGRAEVGRAMHEIMREKLTASAFAKIDGLGVELVRSKDVEELKGRYREVMRTIADLAKQMPPEVGADDTLWMGVYGRMRDAIELKNREGVAPQAVEALKAVASEFEDEIEDEFVTREIERNRVAGKSTSVEHLMAKIYGRTPEEVEELKVRNREEVVAEIMRLKDDPRVSIETLERLHALNNRGIVPKAFSRLRLEEEGITFGKRIGLHAEDARVEMMALLARAEALIGRDIVKGVSDPLYEMAAAKLHNDLLDIHPFPDRNGSSAMLFLEFLMSKKGYTPDSARPDGYYEHLRAVLGNNPVAIGIVGYQHYKIRHVAGHYEGESFMQDEAKTKMYREISKGYGKEVAKRRAALKRGEKKRPKKP